MSTQKQTEKKSSKQFHRPPSKMHGKPSTTVDVECFAERKSYTRLSSLEGRSGYNLYSWLLKDVWI